MENVLENHGKCAEICAGAHHCCGVEVEQLLRLC